MLSRSKLPRHTTMLLPAHNPCLSQLPNQPTIQPDEDWIKMWKPTGLRKTLIETPETFQGAEFLN
jgi:hypothetical protein